MSSLPTDIRRKRHSEGPPKRYNEVGTKMLTVVGGLRHQNGSGRKTEKSHAVPTYEQLDFHRVLLVTLVATHIDGLPTNSVATTSSRDSCISDPGFVLLVRVQLFRLRVCWGQCLDFVGSTVTSSPAIHFFVFATEEGRIRAGRTEPAKAPERFLNRGHWIME